MKCDVVLAGVGGHGVVSLGMVLAACGRADGLEVKLSEVHGMAQRGGSVQANLRLSDEPIHGALIARGTADLILGTEPLESLRYAEALSPDGVMLSSTDPHENIPDYPDIEELKKRLRALPRVVLIEATRLAREAGTARAANVVMAGAATRFLPLKVETLEDQVRKAFARKGESVVAANLAALHKGREAAECPQS
jgi:indolepyruvate ferredoxin oxidoreductase beta subunit